MSQTDKQQLKRLQASRREVSKLCDKTEKTLVPLQRALVAIAGQASNPELIERIEDFQSRLSMINAALHQLQKKRFERDGGASTRIATRLVSGMSNSAGLETEEGAEAPQESSPILQGQAPGFPILQALEFIEANGKSGTLQIQLPAETISFQFHDGQIVHTATDQPRRGERLGEILVEKHNIAFEHMMAFLDVHRSCDTFLGLALVEGGIVSEGALTDALVDQMQQRFDRVFAHEDCSFAFFEGPTSASTGLRFRIGEFLIDAGHRPDSAVAPASAPTAGNVWESYGAPPEQKFRGTPNDEWGTSETK